MSLNLKYKILSGYLILIAVIGSMAVILFHERKRMREIEIETKEIREVRGTINNVHRCIIELTTRGETVIAWDDMAYKQYRNLRLYIDSILQSMKWDCHDIVSSEQVDTLRNMLRDKESHLMHIMETIHKQKVADNILIKHLQFISNRDSTKMIEWDMENLGNLKTLVSKISSAKNLRKVQDMMISIQAEYGHEICVYTDSLRIQNEKLNKNLYTFITHLDWQAQNALKNKEEKIMEAQEFSLRLLSIVIIVAIVLLFVSFLIIQNDIEIEKIQKEKLQQIIEKNNELLDMRKKIILTVSHDVRGPLGNINNCAELASYTRKKKKREFYLENIRHSCRHILHLVNDLMDAYRINEMRDINNIPFHLDSFIHRISDNFSHKANSQALIFKTTYKNIKVAVKGDPDKIERVLTNLLTNAVKFTPSGSIHFISEYREGQLFVEIRDTGIGMDEATLSRVFFPFERAAQNISSEGFGLGLFITKGLVEVLSGTMKVNSEFGKGSVFQVIFPLPEIQEPIENKKNQKKLLTILPKKILVVDDDPILLKVIEDMLEHNGIMCTTCINIKEAVSALYGSNYDLVLTDIQMPVTDGFGLLELFRNSDIGVSKTIPIAVMTAHRDANWEIYMRSGFCGCLHKPFEMTDLIDFLSDLVTKNGYWEFDFSRLLEHTDDCKDMLSLIICESEKDLYELKQTLKQKNLDGMREIIHRMLPVWEMLGKQEVFYEFQEVLHNVNVKEDLLMKSAQKVMEWIQKLINESKKRIDNNENINC